MGSMQSHSKQARLKGKTRKARAKRAERREATKEIRERINVKMRNLHHRGWIE